MRRSYFNSFGEDSGVFGALKKIRTKLSDAFVKNSPDQQDYIKQNEKENNSLTFNGNISSTPVNNRSRHSSFQNNSQNQITAKQLEEYYNSLKREHEMLADELNHPSVKNSLSSVELNSKSNNWNNAESTNIEPETNKTDDNGNANNAEDNQIILFDENKSDSKMGMDKDLDDLFPMYSQPDPLERANLVQLKKMMELEKYRRYRLSYLREHTRHLKKQSNTKTAKNIKKDKMSKYSKNIDLKKLPANRKNTAGTFGISLLDTVNDEEPDADNLIKPIDNDVVSKLKFPGTKNTASSFDISTKPRSFNPELEKPIIKNDDIIKSKTEIESVEIKRNAPKIGFNLDSKPKIEDVAAKASVSIDDVPSIAFNFAAQSKDTSKEAKPAFSFGSSNPTETKEEESKTPFNFGKNTKVPVVLETIPDRDGLNDPKMNFLKKPEDSRPLTETGNIKIPSFFDSKPKAEKSFSLNISKPSTEEKKEGSKLAFSLNPPKPNITSNDESRPKPTFSFGTPATSESLSVPKLSLGAGSEKPTEKSAPAFTFNSSTTSTEKKPDGKEKSAIPAFNFNSTTSAKLELAGVSSSVSPEKPKFSFGLPAKPEDKSGSKSFNFGGETKTRKNDDAKPIFGSLNIKPADSKPAFGGFGAAAAEKKDDSTSAFGGFGATTEKKPEETKSAFGNFGSTTENKPPTTFSFTKPSEEKKDEATSKPAFSFGGSTGSEPVVFGKPDSTVSKPVISFGGNSVPNGTADNKIENKLTPGKFDFGKNTSSNEFAVPDANKTMTTTGSFNFNKSSTTPAQPSIAFGNNSSTNSEVKPAAPTTSFSFGGNNGNASPASVFGASPTPSSTAVAKPAFGGSSTTPSSSAFGGFGANNSSSGFEQNNNSSGFGQNNNIATTAPSDASTQTAGKIFSFNSSAFPSLDSVPKATGFGSTAPSNFNFNANNNSSNNNGGFGAGSSFGSNGISNNSNNANNGGMFGMNNNNNNNNNAGGNSGFNFGSGPSSAATSRASTPNFNFTGKTNVDPSTVFGATSNNNNSNVGNGMGQMVPMNQMGMNMGQMGQMSQMSQMGQIGQMGQNLPSNIQTRKKAYPRRRR